MNKFYVAQLAKTAAASVAVAHVDTALKSTNSIISVIEEQIYVTEPTWLPQPVESSLDADLFQIPNPDILSEWSPKLEKEFRVLSLAEATGKIDGNQLQRLEMLSKYREEFEHPRSSEEVLLQIRRDALLRKMAGIFQEYLELKHAPNRKRFPTE